MFMMETYVGTVILKYMVVNVDIIVIDAPVRIAWIHSNLRLLSRKQVNHDVRSTHSNLLKLEY